MRARQLDPEFDPRLVEAAVLGAVREPAHERAFHAERDDLYGITESEPRDAAFDALHARWFVRLGLDRPFRDAIGEEPRVAAGCGRWLVAAARGVGDEAGDLLVGSDVRPTLLVRVTPGTVAVVERLWPLLRRELLHAADMLAPGFGYAAALPLGAGSGGRERSIRDNYRVLWNAYVDGRLVRLGALPGTVRAERLCEFERAFPHLGLRTGAAFEEFFGGQGLTHAVLMAFAAGGPSAPNQARGAGRSDLPIR